MRIIDRKKLTDLIRVIRKYWKTSDTDYLELKYHIGQALARQTTGSELNESGFTGMIGAIIGGFGLRKNATNEEIFSVFRMLGYEISEPEQTDNPELLEGREE